MALQIPCRGALIQRIPRLGPCLLSCAKRSIALHHRGHHHGGVVASPPALPKLDDFGGVPFPQRMLGFLFLLLGGSVGCSVLWVLANLVGSTLLLAFAFCMIMQVFCR